MHVLSQITGRPLDAITLRDLTVECIIGVHPEEKIRPQTLKLDVSLYLDTSVAAGSGILSRTVDYSLVAKQLTFILTHSRFHLLESAAEALGIFLLTTPGDDAPTIHAIELEIRKPQALAGIAEPAVRIFRTYGDRPRTLAKPNSKRILFQVPEAVIERWHIPAGQTLQAMADDGLFLMTESPGVRINEKIVSQGSILPVSEAMTLTHAEPGTKAITILAVTFRGRERFHQSANRLH